MEIDNVFLEIGESGRQQIKYGLMLCLTKMYHPLHTLQYNFVARQTGFRCHQSEGVYLNNSCPHDETLSCSSLEYSEHTIVGEWNLVCDRNWLSKVTMSALMLGFLLGSIFLGRLADIIGRKKNFTLTLIGLLICNLMSGFTSSFIIYTMTRFLVGIFLAGNILTAITLLTEIVGPSYRGIYLLCQMGSFAIGICALSFLASHLQHSWRQLTIVVSLIGVPLLCLHWLLIESPRWLLAQNRQEEAEAVLRSIARGNGVTGKLDINLRPTQITSRQVSSDSVVTLFTSPRLMTVSLILCYAWFVVGGTYYGLTIAAGHIGTDIYTGTALSGLVELPAVFIIYYAIEIHGRKTGVVGFLSMAGMFCLCVKIMPSMTTVFALCGKLCIAGAFKVIYLISSEIFATSVRNSALGIASALARVGAIMAPFIVMLGESSPGLQFFIFGVLCLSGGLLSSWLPETKNKPLPESVREMLVDKDKKMDTQHV